MSGRRQQRARPASDPSIVTLLSALPLAAALLAQPARFGLLACQGPSSELANREYFVLCHDSSLRVFSWTAYELLRGNLGGTAPRPRGPRSRPDSRPPRPRRRLRFLGRGDPRHVRALERRTE